MGVKKILDDTNIRIIFNPGHDQMTRHEMAKKRAYLSEDGRWVVSIWNRNTDKRIVGKLGWQVRYGSYDRTETIQMLEASTFGWSEKIKVGLLPINQNNRN